MWAKIKEYLLVLAICIASLEADSLLMTKIGFLDVSYPSYSTAYAKPFWPQGSNHGLAEDHTP